MQLGYSDLWREEIPGLGLSFKKLVVWANSREAGSRAVAMGLRRGVDADGAA